MLCVFIKSKNSVSNFVDVGFGTVFRKIYFLLPRFHRDVCIADLR